MVRQNCNNCQDADESIIEEVKLICDNNNIEVIYVDEMKN